MPKKKKKGSALEDDFAKQMEEAGITGFERDVTFIPGRRFRADFWFPKLKLAIEVDGGLWKTYSGHGYGAGAHQDRERDILAYLKGGILTFRVGTNHVNDGDALEWVKEILKRRKDDLSVR